MIMKRLYTILAIGLLMPFLVSCDRSGKEPRSYEKVMLLYSCGKNSLSTYLERDIADLMSSDLPYESSDGVVLVLSHKPTKYESYVKDTAPVLYRLYNDRKGRVHADTLMVMPETSISASSSALRGVLSYVKEKFPAKSYGMIFSSHATGWLPEGYYESGAGSVDIWSSEIHGPARLPDGAVPYRERKLEEGEPLTRSIGETVRRIDGVNVSYQMSLQDFVSGIPMKLDYLIFDACLMGCIEVAYELKDVTDIVSFSPAEVLAEGLDYKTVVSYLIKSSAPDVAGVARRYFETYDAQTGINRSATISTVDCRRLDALADVCRKLFSTYREEIASLDPDEVQRYFRSHHHWFFDLEDIVIKAGATEDEIRELESALNSCMIYKASTDSFMKTYGGFDITMYSGLSMYLPTREYPDWSYLNGYYRNLAWNIATGLVE